MLNEKTLSKKQLVILSSLFVAAILGIQLVAATAWTADAANTGPQIVILQMSQDPDTNWAVQDLQQRLSTFITDDSFFPDRVRLVKTSDPYMAMELKGAIIIYASHGGPLGIVTGRRLTLWETMADIVSNSNAIMHLFTACCSRNIIQYGDDSSGKKLYTVPGARPAEVTDVEIVSAIMLTLGISSDSVDMYRTTELARAKDIIESGATIHLMDFSQIVLDEVEYVDDHYSDTYTDTHRVYRYSVEQTLSGTPGFVSLPLELQSTIVDYYRSYIDQWGVPTVRNLVSLGITYTKSYYYESIWIVDETPPPPPDPDPIPPPDPDPIPPPRPDVGDPGLFSASYIMTATAANGHWENGPNIFSGGAYAGVIIYSGDGCDYLRVAINVTASGTTLDANGKTNPESISLNQIDARGIYVQKQKVDGIWQEPVTGRSPSRTGGQFTDSCVKADYEYDSSWPNIPGVSGSTGALSSTGEYLTMTGIPTGSSWHGPSFVRTLPSYFKLKDLGTLSANLSIVQHGSAAPMSFTAVSLYDTNKRLAASIIIADFWSGLQQSGYEVRYYKADGTSFIVRSPYYVGDTNGIVQIRYDPLRGIFGDAPGISDTCLAYRNQLGNEGERLIKYLVIQSCRYGSYAEQDERIYSISLSYAGSEYTVFHDTCNDMDEFIKTPSFPYGSRSDGTLAVPSGQSYMKFTSIATGSNWHGPIYINTLDRPFRLYQLDEFSVIGELVQSSSTMGKTYVALFDENMQCVLLVFWGDSWVGSTQGYFDVIFYPQNGGSYSQNSPYIYSSFTKTGKLWWTSYPGGQGGIMASIDGSGDAYPIGECDNASRVIKYVGILGYRYNSYNLVDMRIHDINVVTDLNEHDPNAPSLPPPTQDPPSGGTQTTVGSDGTSDGAVQSLDQTPESQSLIDVAIGLFSQIVSWWEGWWPRLHMLISFATAMGGIATLHFSVDMLFDFRAESYDLDTPVDDQMTADQYDRWSTQVAMATHANGEWESFLGSATEFMSWVIAGICGVLAVPGLGLSACAEMALAALGAWTVWFDLLMLAYCLELVSSNFILGLLSAWLLTFVGKAVSCIVTALCLTYLIARERIVFSWGWLKARFIASVISIVFQFFIIVATFYSFATLLEHSIQVFMVSEQ